MAEEECNVNSTDTAHSTNVLRGFPTSNISGEEHSVKMAETQESATSKVKLLERSCQENSLRIARSDG